MSFAMLVTLLPLLRNGISYINKVHRIKCQEEVVHYNYMGNTTNYMGNTTTMSYGSICLQPDAEDVR